MAVTPVGEADVTTTRRDVDEEVTIAVCPDGPLLVRGPALIVDADGLPVPRRRATVALCRCGRTSIAPYCDGAHKRRGAAAAAATS
ncbi:hypothetical protein GCM10023225_35140 [Kineococcus glutinatus]|uniref:Iron-binding zinc finger CDGSH type domain-containing protein n=1 Tax=Kineococcus glutinatus TaxID=1070872 RepID=A0ABP8VGU1_9ACTN